MRYPLQRAAALAALLMLAAPASAQDAKGEVRWLEDAARAVKASRESAKPVLVDVWAVWCVPCKEMERTTYRDPAVVASMAAFVPLKVDHDAQETFVERYDFEALPVVLFLDAEGREITRLTGMISAQRLHQTMEAVRAGYASYLEHSAHLADPAAAVAVGAYLLTADNPEGASALLRRALKGLKDDAGLSATDQQVKMQALAGLVRAERLRGREAEAERALARLRQEFPEAAQLLNP